MSARALAVLLLAVAVTPVHIQTACATEPETPIEVLLIDIAVEQPKRPVSQIVLDLVVPPLQLRRLVAANDCCPCAKVCCFKDCGIAKCGRRLSKAFDRCCIAMRHCLVSQSACLQERTEQYPGCDAGEPGDEQECTEPECSSYPHCPAGCPPRCTATGTCIEPMDNSDEDGCADEASSEAQSADEPEVLEVMPKEVEEQSDAQPEKCAAEKRCTGAARPCTREKKSSKCEKAQKAGCPATPLDAMDKLMKAFTLYRKAEHCRTEGQTEKACRLYEKVKKLCPGSRFEYLACRRLEQIYAAKGMKEAGGVEEAEPTPVPSPCYPPENCRNLDRLRGECVKLVDELRAKAHQLIDAGHYVEARALAEAACALNSDCEKAFLLLAQSKALLNKPTSEEPAEEVEPQAPVDPTKQGCYPPEDEEDAEPMPPCVDEYDVVLDPPCYNKKCVPVPGCVKPALPPIDPKVVEVLDCVLQQQGEPCRGTQECAGQEEKCEGLYIDAAEEDLYLEEVVSPDAAAKVLHDFVAAFRERICCDVEVGTPALVRGRMTFQVCNMQCSVICDGLLNRVVLVSLAPAAPDLRDLQHAHVERMLRWIEEINSGGHQPDDDGTASEEDAEEQNLLYWEPFRLY